MTAAGMIVSGLTRGSMTGLSARAAHTFVLRAPAARRENQDGRFDAPARAGTCRRSPARTRRARRPSWRTRGADLPEARSSMSRATPLSSAASRSTMSDCTRDHGRRTPRVPCGRRPQRFADGHQVVGFHRAARAVVEMIRDGDALTDRQLFIVIRRQVAADVRAAHRQHRRSPSSSRSA